MKPFKELINLGLLYLGKLGGILFTILFIPIYRKYLDPTQFGLVSIFISVQMIVYVLDFGFAVHLSRLASQLSARPIKFSFFGLQYQSSLTFLTASYLFIFMLLLGAYLLGILATPFPALSSLLILLIAVFNIKTALLLSSQQYRESSLYQLSSSLVRGGVSALTVFIWNQNLLAFVIPQILVMLAMNGLISRSLKSKLLLKMKVITDKKRLYHSGVILFRRCLPLLITAGVGALCTQADRFVISSVISLEEAGNYFLAATYSLTPILIAAQPVFQYFYPKVIEVYKTHSGEIRHQVFSAVLSLATVLSSFILYFFADWIVGIWLGHALYTVIWPYISILLIATIISALSYGPYAMMLCEGKYQDMKKVTMVTVSFYALSLTLAALQKSLLLICASYLVFNLVTILCQTYFCLKYVKSRPLVGYYFKHWLILMPYFAVLSFMTGFTEHYNLYRSYANGVLFATVILSVIGILYSLKGIFDGKFKQSLDRRTHP